MSERPGFDIFGHSGEHSGSESDDDHEETPITEFDGSETSVESYPRPINSVRAVEDLHVDDYDPGQDVTHETTPGDTHLAILTPRCRYNRVQLSLDLYVFLNKPTEFGGLTFYGRVYSSGALSSVFVEGGVTGGNSKRYIIIKDGYFEAHGIIFEVKSVVDEPQSVGDTGILALSDIQACRRDAESNRSITLGIEFAYLADSVREVLLFIDTRLSGSIHDIKPSTTVKGMYRYFRRGRAKKISLVSAYTKTFYEKFSGIRAVFFDQAQVGDPIRGSVLRNGMILRAAALDPAAGSGIETIRTIIEGLGDPPSGENGEYFHDAFIAAVVGKLKSLVDVATKIRRQRMH